MRVHTSGNPPLWLALILYVITSIVDCAADVPGPEVEGQQQPIQLHAWTRATEGAQCWIRSGLDPTSQCYTQDGGTGGQCSACFLGGCAWVAFNAFATSTTGRHGSITIGSSVLAEYDYCEGWGCFAQNVYQYDLLYHGNTAACTVSGSVPNRVGNMTREIH